jgi:hypothetical protein
VTSILEAPTQFGTLVDRDAVCAQVRILGIKSELEKRAREKKEKHQGSGQVLPVLPKPPGAVKELSGRCPAHAAYRPYSSRRRTQ